MTPGLWRVVANLTGVWKKANGRVVVTDDNIVVADCRNDELNIGDQRHNAELIAKLPDFVRVLQLAELYFGDLPSSDNDAMELHAKVTLLLNDTGVPLLDPAEGCAELPTWRS